MSRFRKSEYRSEKRDAEKPFVQQQERCEGLMGMCKERNVAPCPRCQKPFCAGGHMNYHLTKCRGMR